MHQEYAYIKLRYKRLAVKLNDQFDVYVNVIQNDYLEHERCWLKNIDFLQMIRNNMFNHFPKPLGLILTQMHGKKCGWGKLSRSPQAENIV